MYMLAGDGEVFETYQKRTTLISEWGRVARYHSRVGHRRCWTAAASKGLLSLVCVVLVLVAMRFASWTMMAVICFSVDDFLLRATSHQKRKKKTRDTCIQQCTRLLLMGMSVGREF